jgi:hypothetical protein
MDNKVKILLAALEIGRSYKINNISIGVKENYFYVNGWTTERNEKILSPEKALGELEEIKSEFSFLIHENMELAELIKIKKIQFNLLFDYGMGSSLICTEKDGIISWAI